MNVKVKIATKKIFPRPSKLVIIIILNQAHSKIKIKQMCTLITDI